LFFTDPATISLIRSGSFMSSSGLTGSAARQYQMQRKGSFDGNGGSDDSMHEKYFKSVENTPVSRRRHTTSSKPSTGGTTVPPPMPKHSSDSSPQSPVSPKNSTNSTKPVRPSVLPMESSSSTNYKSSQKSDPDHFNMDVTSKPERFVQICFFFFAVPYDYLHFFLISDNRYLDKMKLDKERITPIGGAGGPSNSNLISLQQMMKQQHPPPNIASSHTQNEIANKINSLHRNASAHAINKVSFFI
jgi:Rho GTPase-activating protein 39